MADHTTIDHSEIRRWAEERDAVPTVVRSTHDDEGGILRFDLPGYDSGDDLAEVTWDEFFRIFDENRLALVYQEETASGQPSNFSKFVDR